MLIETQEQARTGGNRSRKGSANPAWPIANTRQNLLNAAWGSGKGADLLYHFINKARWEIHNQRLSTETKDVVFQETRPELLASIIKAKDPDRTAGYTFSQGSYNRFLRAFIAAGYIENQPYSDTFAVHLETIEKSFAVAPPMPVELDRRRPRTDEDCVKLTHHTIDTITREEFNYMVELCVNVSKVCQQCVNKPEELTHLCQLLTQNSTIGAAPQAESTPIAGAVEMLLENNANALEKERREKCAFASASSLSPFFDLDLFAEDQIPGETHGRGLEAGNRDSSTRVAPDHHRDLAGDSGNDHALPGDLSPVVVGSQRQAIGSVTGQQPGSEVYQGATLPESGVIPVASCSQPTTIQPELPELKAEVPPIAKPTRKPREPKAPKLKVPQSEVDLYFEVFDALRSEFVEKDSVCPRTRRDREAIEALLEVNLRKPKTVTPERLRAVYREMYNDPYWHTKISTRLVCDHYDQMAIKLIERAKLKAQATGGPSSPGQKQSVTDDATLTKSANNLTARKARIAAKNTVVAII